MNFYAISSKADLVSLGINLRNIQHGSLRQVYIKEAVDPAAMCSLPNGRQCFLINGLWLLPYEAEDRLHGYGYSLDEGIIAATNQSELGGKHPLPLTAEHAEKLTGLIHNAVYHSKTTLRFWGGKVHMYALGEEEC